MYERDCLETHQFGGRKTITLNYKYEICAESMVSNAMLLHAKMDLLSCRLREVVFDG